MILDEPVRGQVPPPWFESLSGFERMDSFARGAIPAVPLARMLGLRIGHLGVGTGTWTMPATGWLQAGTSALQVEALPMVAMQGVGATILPAGCTLVPLRVEFNYYRPTQPSGGSLIARASVINSNRFFASIDAEVEDSAGRRVLASRMQAEIREIETPAPSPPPRLDPVEEPKHATADPWARPVEGRVVSDEELGGGRILSGPQPLSGSDSGNRVPLSIFFGLSTRMVREGEFEMSGPASGWYALNENTVNSAVLVTLLCWANGGVARSGPRIGSAIANLSQQITLYRPLPADGRRFHVDAKEAMSGGREIECTAQLFDEAGNLIARGLSYSREVDVQKRRRRTLVQSRRGLHTLLFTDIVGSTEHLARLGDAKWRERLEDHHRRIRSEITRCQGTEVKTQGDGFFVRFSSPALALDCARAAREAVKPLGIQIRQGVHIGECEEHGADLAGLAVHLASRIQGKAGAGEILVSNTVKDLVAGSGLKFADRGEHELKGIEGTWRLWALEG